MSKKEGFFKGFSEYIERCKKFLDDEVWQGSFWLKRKQREAKTALESLEAAKQDLESQVDDLGKEVVHKAMRALKQIPDGSKEVFILLNQFNGKDIEKWEQALQALPSCAIGRPVYADESSARNSVKIQGETENTGYVAIAVKVSDILRDDQEFDANGQAVLVLKPGAIEVRYIRKFVHYNQDVYLFINNKLVLDPDYTSLAEPIKDDSEASDAPTQKEKIEPVEEDSKVEEKAVEPAPAKEGGAKPVEGDSEASEQAVKPAPTQKEKAKPVKGDSEVGEKAIEPVPAKKGGAKPVEGDSETSEQAVKPAPTQKEKAKSVKGDSEVGEKAIEPAPAKVGKKTKTAEKGSDAKKSKE